MFGDVCDLIERCIRRDEKAWEKFIKRFSGLLFYSARERLKRSGISFTTQDLEDIVQSTFTEILDKARLEEVRERKKIEAYLSIMAQTRAINYMRQRRELLLGEDELYKIENMTIDTGGREANKIVALLEETIEELPDRDKIILKMSLIYGKTHREIAQFMKLPQNTVSAVIARKKKFLRRRVQENG